MVIKDKKDSNKSILTKAIFSFLIIFLVALGSYYYYTITGQATFEIGDVYYEDGVVNGLIKFNIKEGELIPEDSIVSIKLGDQVEQFKLNELVKEKTISGDFYAEGKSILGNGTGYGVQGIKTKYPVVSFELKVKEKGKEEEEQEKNFEQESGSSGQGSSSQEEVEGEIVEEQNEKIEENLTQEQNETIIPGQNETIEEEQNETLEEVDGQNETIEEVEEQPIAEEVEEIQVEEIEITPALITGEAISDLNSEQGLTVDGQVSKNKEFVFLAEANQEVSLFKGSVFSEGELLPDNILDISRDGDRVVVETGYIVEERGFGEDYLGDVKKIISFDLAFFNLTSDEESLEIELIYGESMLAMAKAKVFKEENLIDQENISEAKSNLSLLKNVENFRIKSGQSESLILSDYFSGAQTYAVIISDIDAVLSEDTLTLVPQEGFKGLRKAKIIAYDSSSVLESNEFEIFISSGNIEVETERGQVVLGQKVKWTKNVKLDEPEEITVQIPVEAENISVKKLNQEQTELEEIEPNIIITADVVIEVTSKEEGIFTRAIKAIIKSMKSITGAVVQSEEVVDVVLNESSTNYILEYYTEGPTAEEYLTDRGKEVVVYAPDELNYTNVLTFTEISEIVSVGEEDNIRIVWKNTGENIVFDAYDLDGDFLIDYVEWITPHLSTQTFEIILISNAAHLDSDKNFLADVYEEVSILDDTKYTIPLGEYLRVYFEENLTSEKDITIYANSISGENARVEVYEGDTENKITEFTNVNEFGKKTVLLTNLIGQTDFFDLKVLDASVEFDYIVDPVVALNNCVVINQSGSYLLGASFTANKTGVCFNITVSNIILDGNNQDVGANSSGNSYGVLVSQGIENITIKNFGALEGFDTGIGVNGAAYNLVIYNNYIDSTLSGNYGIRLEDSRFVFVSENYIRDGAYGISYTNDDSISIVHNNNITGPDSEELGLGGTESKTFIIYNNSVGRINLTGEADLYSGTNTLTFPGTIKISNDQPDPWVYLNSTALSDWEGENIVITLWAGDIVGNGLIKVYKDGTECLENSCFNWIVENPSYDDTVTFNVSSLGNYSLIKTQNITNCVNILESGIYSLVNNISVSSGSYDECIYVNASDVVINGNGKSIYYNGTGSNYHLIQVPSTSQNVTIKNFRNLSVGSTSTNSAVYANANDLTIYNNTFNENYISVRLVPRNTFTSLFNITDNVIYNSGLGTGLYFVGLSIESYGNLSNGYIYGNNISSDIGNAVLAQYLVNTTFENNFFESRTSVSGGPAQGIIRGASPSTLFNNTFINNNYSLPNTDTRKVFGNAGRGTIIFNNSKGEIRFENILLDGFYKTLSFPGTINISNNNANFSITNISSKTARVTLNNTNTSYYSSTIFKDGTNCISSGICTNLTSLDSGNVSFTTNVEGAYRLGDNATTVTSCQTISNPGYYVLTSDITGATGTCFTISVDGVTFDGNGKTIDMSKGIGDTGFVISEGNSVKIKNVTLSDLGRAITLTNTENSLIEDLTVINHTGISAIHFAIGAESNTLSRINITGTTGYGVYILSSADNNILKESEISGFTSGIFVGSSNNTIKNTNITDFSSYATWESSLFTGNNLFIFNNSFGNLKINLTKTSLSSEEIVFPSSDISITNRSVYFNSSRYSQMNSTTNITFYGDSLSKIYNPTIFGKTENSSVLGSSLSSQEDNEISFEVPYWKDEQGYTFMGYQEIPLSTGWNAVSFLLDDLESGQESVSVSAGWNLIGSISANNTTISNIGFSNESTNLTRSQALAQGKVQKRLASLNPNTKRYDIVSEETVDDDQALRPGRGYWVYANESGNLTIPGRVSRGTETLALSEIIFKNLTSGEEKTLSEAVSAGWVGGTVNEVLINFIYSEETGYEWVSLCGQDPSFCINVLDSNPYIYSNNSYFVWSHESNLVILRKA